MEGERLRNTDSATRRRWRVGKQKRSTSRDTEDSTCLSLNLSAEGIAAWPSLQQSENGPKGGCYTTVHLARHRSQVGSQCDFLSFCWMLQGTVSPLCPSWLQQVFWWRQRPVQSVARLGSFTLLLLGRNFLEQDTFADKPSKEEVLQHQADLALLLPACKEASQDASWSASASAAPLCTGPSTVQPSKQTCTATPLQLATTRCAFLWSTSWTRSPPTKSWEVLGGWSALTRPISQRGSAIRLGLVGAGLSDIRSSCCRAASWMVSTTAAKQPGRPS